MGRSNEVGLDNLVPRQCDLQNEGNSVAMETNEGDNVVDMVDDARGLEIMLRVLLSMKKFWLDKRN